MKKALQVFFITFTILFISVTANALAEDEVDFSQMANEIRLQPWASYQKLIAMETKAKSFDETKYLWWLLRKAQAENFIYYFDDFHHTIEQAIALITDKTPLAIQAGLNIYQGIIYRRKGKYLLSQEFLSKALTQAKTANLDRLYITGKHELAFTRVLTEYYDSSLVDLQEAYVEAFAIKDQFLMASINEAYGVVYNYLHQFELSIEYYKRALYSYQHLQYPVDIADAMSGLAVTYRYWKKYDLAIEYYKKYQEALSYAPNAKDNFYAAYGLAITYAEKGSCELAITAIERALSLKGFSHYDAELYKKKASCLITLQRLDEAEDALFHAASEFAKLPGLMGTSWQLEVIKISGELTHARGKYDLGYKMLKQYYEQYAELLVKKTSKELEKVKKGLEYERLKMIKSLEKKRVEVELLELEKQKTIIAQELYLKILIACLVLIVFVVVLLQVKNNKKIKKLTIKDPLTDLFNRRYIFDYLDHLLSSKKSSKTELSLVLINIDDFKNINDKFGYPVGDEVIRKIANIGKQVFRQCDIFSRIEEGVFLCALPRTSIHEAEKIAQRLLQKVEQSDFIADEKYNVTISIGVSALSSQCNDSTQLFVNAEQALFDAKHTGKSQVNTFKENNFKEFPFE